MCLPVVAALIVLYRIHDSTQSRQAFFDDISVCGICFLGEKDAGD